MTTQRRSKPVMLGSLPPLVIPTRNELKGIGGQVLEGDYAVINYDYSPLKKIMAEKGMTTSALRRLGNFTPNAMSCISNNRHLEMINLLRLCYIFGVELSDIVKISFEVRNSKEKKDSWILPDDATRARQIKTAKMLNTKRANEAKRRLEEERLRVLHGKSQK